ncbi:hypothetical protein PLESTM_000734500 [Pleodorina starrii]|nr:hypothetical protein PLESTM_000734500 [Pleodorina starrii]
MQLGRLLPRGLVSLNSRIFYASRILPSRTLRVCAAPGEHPDAVAEQEQEGLRVPGSRRTLFHDTAPPASEDSLTSKRKLLEIHKQSLQDAGVNLSPFEIQTNRLHSVRSSLRKETRGAARAAVSREFRVAERRLYSSQRRLGRRGEEEEEAGHEAGREGRQGGEVQQQQRQQRQQRKGVKSGKAKELGPNPVALQGAAKAAAKAVAAQIAYKRSTEAAAQARAAQVLKGGDDDDADDSNDDSDVEEGEFEGEETFSLEDAIRRARVERGREAGGKVRPVTELLPREHEEEEEGEEEGGPGRTFVGPRLSHNLPTELNLRLLEKVMAGSRNTDIPEIPVGASGLTPGCIMSMMVAWRTNELVKLRIRNKRKVAKKYLPYIRQVCDVIEARSGGVVVWRSGRSIWVFRGENYVPVDPKKVAEELLGKSEVPLYCPPLTAKRQPLGKQVQLGGGREQSCSGYLTRGSATLLGEDPAGPPSALEGLGLIFLHDAFGPGTPDTQEHSKQVCDLLSSLLGPGTPVLMPDLTAGGRDGWRAPQWPPLKPIYERQNGWIGKDGKGNPAAVVSYVEAAVSYLRGPGVGATRIAIVGTGWGGWIATHMLAADATRCRLLQEAEDDKTAAAAAAAVGAAASSLLRAMSMSPVADAGPLAQGLWLLHSPEAKAYRQAKVTARYGIKRPRQQDPEPYLGGGEPLVFSAGVVGSANHFFEDEERLALAISVPLVFMCSKWDPMEKFQLYMQSPLVDKCAFKRFGKIKPGFWGKTAEWSDTVQATQATQAAELASWFLRWHEGGHGVSSERIRKFCMVGKCGVGEKQTTNLYFPWLEQVTLFRGREKTLEREERLRRKEEGLPPTRKDAARMERQARKKERGSRMQGSERDSAQQQQQQEQGAEQRGARGSRVDGDRYGSRDDERRPPFGRRRGDEGGSDEDGGRSRNAYRDRDMSSGHDRGGYGGERGDRGGERGGYGGKRGGYGGERGDRGGERGGYGGERGGYGGERGDRGGERGGYGGERGDRGGYGGGESGRRYRRQEEGRARGSSAPWNQRGRGRSGDDE